MSTTSLLSSSPLFIGMSPDECSTVLGMAEFHAYPTGKTLIREGTQRRTLHVLLQGECTVVKTMKHGAEHQLAILKPGALFGEVSFFDHGEHSSTVRAIAPVEVMELSWENFQELQEQCERSACQLTRNMACIMAQRFRKLHSYIVEMMDHPTVSPSSPRLGSLHRQMFH